MEKEKLKKVTTITIIFISALIFFSFKGGDITLQFTGDENFYFESSRRMIEERDWITPVYFGQKRFQKPFLFYWLIGASFKIFGVNWWAARFPSFLLGALTVLLTYLIALELFNKKAGIFSVLVLATSLKFFKYTRAAIPDMTLLFFTTLAIYFFIKLRSKSKARDMLFPAFFISMGLATLTKGPVGFIIPFIVAIVFIILSKERFLLRELRIIPGLIIYLLVLAPWFFVMVKLYGDEFLNHILTREIIQRVVFFSGTENKITGFLEYVATLFFYIPIIIVRFLPWSLFIPFALVSNFHFIKVSNRKKGELFVLSWFFVVLLFFSIIGEKHSQYMLAISPPLALILGSYFWRSSVSGRLKTSIPIAIAAILVLTFLLLFSFPVFRPNSVVYSEFSAAILEHSLRKEDRVGAGSHELIPQKLEVFLGRSVENVSTGMDNPVEKEKFSKFLLRRFFTSKKRVFCLVKKEDFLKFVDPALRKKLFVIDKDSLWKRKFTIGHPLKDEYWLVTNKKLKN